MDATRRKREAKRDFLLALQANGGHVMEACKAAGVSRTTIGNYRDEDDVFAEMWASTQEANIERLEMEVDRRAVDGIEREVRYKGEVVGVERQFSDILLMFRLKALRPEKYRDGPGVKGKAGDLSDAELDDVLKRYLARRTASGGKLPDEALITEEVQ